MPSQAFSIEQPITSVPLQDEHRVGFTVNNNLGRDVLVNAYVEIHKGDDKLEGIEWIAIAGESTFDLASDGSIKVEVRVAVPATLPAEWKEEKASLTFRLMVKNVDSPDKENGESVPITLHPVVEKPPDTKEPEKEPSPPNNLWKILAIAGGGLALVAIIAVVLVMVLGDDDPVPEPPPQLAGEWDQCSDAVQCSDGLMCGPSLGRCVPSAAAPGGYCDPTGPACPFEGQCVQLPDGANRCQNVVDSGKPCGDPLTACEPPLVCGPGTKVCVPKVPQTGDLCDPDPAAPKCPSGTACVAAGGGFQCAAQDMPPDPTPVTGTWNVALKDFRLVYVPSTQTIQMQSGGFVISYGQGWRPEIQKTYLYRLYPPGGRTDTYWKINTSRKEIYLTTPQVTDQVQGTSEAIESTPPRVQASINQAFFRLDTANKKVNFFAGGLPVSGQDEWRVVEFAPGKFHTARTNWRGFFWFVDVPGRKLYVVRGGTFGSDSGSKQDLEATVTPVRLRINPDILRDATILRRTQ